MIGFLFPAVSLETRRELYFFLTYQQHGGGGLSWTPTDVDNLELGEVFWHAERLRSQREREARAIEAAHRKKR